MNDKELADKIVALGIGYQNPHPQSCDGVGFYTIDDDGMCANLFVRDWRVVGAMLERHREIRYGGLEALFALSAIDFIAKDDSLPRAINEACVEALNGR